MNSCMIINVNTNVRVSAASSPKVCKQKWPKPLKTAQKAITLHTFGFQVVKGLKVTLGIQIAQSRYYSHTLGPKGIIYMLGSLGIANTWLQPGAGRPPAGLSGDEARGPLRRHGPRAPGGAKAASKHPTLGAQKTIRILILYGIYSIWK